jgi:hypothetical protein
VDVVVDGQLVHRGILRAGSGRSEARLEVAADWFTGDGSKLLEETTTLRFQAAPAVRAIDRITRLRATGQAVRFSDNKDGVLGLRVRRELEVHSLGGDDAS